MIDKILILANVADKAVVDKFSDVDTMASNGADEFMFRGKAYIRPKGGKGFIDKALLLKVPSKIVRLFSGHMKDADVGAVFLYILDDIEGGSFTEPARKTVNVLIASANLVVALCCMGKSGHAYIEAAFFDAVGIHHVLEAVHFLEDDLTVEEDALTVDSEFCPVAGSAEEGKPHFLFQLADDVAQLGLGNIGGFIWRRQQNSVNYLYPW